MVGGVCGGRGKGWGTGTPRLSEEGVQVQVRRGRQLRTNAIKEISIKESASSCRDRLQTESRKGLYVGKQQPKSSRAKPKDPAVPKEARYQTAN